MTCDPRHLKYLEWLEQRGQRYPSRARARYLMMVHGETALSDSCVELMARIAAACGYRRQDVRIHGDASLRCRVGSAVDGPCGLMVAFGDSSEEACRHWAQRVGTDSAIIVKAAELSKLETDPAAKRDLWQQLQLQKGNVQTQS